MVCRDPPNVRPSTFLCALSCALLLALVAMWARSFVCAEYISHYSPLATLDFYSEAGGLHYARSPGDAGAPLRWMFLRLRESSDRTGVPWRTKMIGRFDWSSDSALGQSLVSVPYWTLVLLAAAYPAWWARRAGPGRRWLRIVVAAAFGLWPFELICLAPYAGESDLWDAAGAWILSLLVALLVLVLRDIVRSWWTGQREPWPWQWRLRRAIRRYRNGLCVACGYDLRADPEGGGVLLPRCPECGTPTRFEGEPVVEASGALGK